jgi:hypothetical protein
MVRCSPLSEVAAADVAEVKNQDRVESTAEVVQTIGADEVPTTSDDEKRLSSPGGMDSSLGECASNDENSQTYNFGACTITLG